MNTSKENRMHHRVQPDNLLALLSYESKVVKIIDISEGGMAFHYVSKRCLTDIFPNLQLDILHRNNNYLNDINVFVVSDSLIVEGSLSIRRCGVKFNNLSSRQQEKIHEFLLCYSEGNA